MKWTLTHTAALALSLAPLSAAATDTAPSNTEASNTQVSATQIELRFQTLRDFDLSLPAERFVPIAETLPFSGVPSGALRVEVTDDGLSFDRDGDGQLDATVTEPDEDHPTRLVTFRLADGTEYAVRVKHDGPWAAAPGGAMVGRVGDERIAILDQNGNGRFDDFGADAMVIGRGKVAGFLSKVVPLGGELFELSISPNGREASFTPYTGATGTLDLSTDFETKAKLRSVVLTEVGGELSFELSGAVASKEAVRLPAGEYRLHSGEIVLGKSHATLTPGRSAAISVPASGKAAFAWGGPVSAEFRYERGGGKLQIGPSDIEYYGRAGEVYSNFMPLGSSPKFEVKEKATGKVLVDMVFPGNC
ncbi:MAG: hypothetical protein H8D72_01460 [Planctomycetes bacterium]|nr:hypothetical protein [Planctomycetota bacterium]